MSPAARVRLGLGLVVAVIVSGTVLYVLVEGASFVDALYMVLITISTVGYREVFPLGAGGLAITMGLIVVGVGAALYTAGAALELAFDNVGRRARIRMQRQIDTLHDHYIICGFGRVGSAVWELMTEQGAAAVVVDRDPELVEAAIERGALAIEGDATHNDCLEQAGIDRASALVACVSSDSDNLVIVLSAKALRPDLLVVARAADPESESKLFMAGADRVVAPQKVGAHRMAAMALQPELAEYMDLVVQGGLFELRVKRLQLPEGCALAHRPLRDAGIRQRSGAIVIAIEDTDGRLHLNPDPDIVLRPGQVLVAIGTAAQLERLEELLKPGRRPVDRSLGDEEAAEAPAAGERG